MAWKIAERKIVGEAEVAKTPPPGTPPAAPYTPLPSGGPAFVAATPAEKETPTGFLAQHRQIKRFIDKEGKEGMCPNITHIAVKTGLSEEVVKQHVSVMQYDEAVALMQNVEDPPVCSVDGLNKLVGNLRKLRL